MSKVKYKNFVSTDIIKYEYEEKNLSTLGKRIKKNVNGIITSYEYLGDLLIKEEKKYLNGDTEKKEYYYNESNELIKIIYEDKETKKEIYVIRDLYHNIKYLMEDGKIVETY